MNGFLVQVCPIACKYLQSIRCSYVSCDILHTLENVEERYWALIIVHHIDVLGGMLVALPRLPPLLIMKWRIVDASNLSLFNFRDVCVATRQVPQSEKKKDSLRPIRKAIKALSWKRDFAPFEAFHVSRCQSFVLIPRRTAYTDVCFANRN